MPLHDLCVFCGNGALGEECSLCDQPVCRDCAEAKGEFFDGEVICPRCFAEAHQKENPEEGKKEVYPWG